jgi:hypothetical protein
MPAGAAGPRLRFADSALVGLLAELLCSGDGTGREGTFSATPNSSDSILFPAATLKSKQDELHRKALQTLER